MLQDNLIQNKNKNENKKQKNRLIRNLELSMEVSTLRPYIKSTKCSGKKKNAAAKEENRTVIFKKRTFFRGKSKT